MEKSHWSAVNQPIIDRLKNTATAAVEGKSLTPLQEVHVLDLARDGHIKPHTDSVKVWSNEKRLYLHDIHCENSLDRSEFDYACILCVWSKEHCVYYYPKIN